MTVQLERYCNHEVEASSRLTLEQLLALGEDEPEYVFSGGRRLLLHKDTYEVSDLSCLVPLEVASVLPADATPLSAAHLVESKSDLDTAVVDYTLAQLARRQVERGQDPLVAAEIAADITDSKTKVVTLSEIIRAEPDTKDEYLDEIRKEIADLTDDIIHSDESNRQKALTALETAANSGDDITRRGVAEYIEYLTTSSGLSIPLGPNIDAMFNTNSDTPFIDAYEASMKSERIEQNQITARLIGRITPPSRLPRNANQVRATIEKAKSHANSVRQRIKNFTIEATQKHIIG
ncbi:hypothetical protein EON76_05695 [bacterium]|nr:MAG: hypothetical protein EON76_05695 [bacterium]